MNPLFYIVGGILALLVIVLLAQRPKRRTLPGGRVRAHVPGTSVRGRSSTHDRNGC